MARAVTALQGAKGVNAQTKKNLQILHDNMASTGGIHDIVNQISRIIRRCRPSTPTRASSGGRSSGCCSCPQLRPPSTTRPRRVAQAGRGGGDEGRLGSMQMTFAGVFGSDSQLGLFIDYATGSCARSTCASRWPTRRARRAGGRPEADAKATSRSSRSSRAPRSSNAYTAFMSAFFYHKEIASLR
jgi:hypothetical protein